MDYKKSHQKNKINSLLIQKKVIKNHETKSSSQNLSWISVEK